MFRTVLAVILLLLPELPGQARAMYGKAAVVIRDSVTRQPLSGARVRMQYAGSEETGDDSERRAAKESTGMTDSSGYATGRVYLGRAQTRWVPFFGAHRQKRVEIQAVRVQAEKPGYKSLETVSNVFYVAFRKGEGTYVFLDELLLAPEHSPEASRVLRQDFAPEASVEPRWGDFSTRFVLRVRTRVPAVLAHEYQDPLLEIVARVPGVERPVSLLDKGRSPDTTPRDGVYSATVNPKGIVRLTIVEQLQLHLDPVSSQHSLLFPRGGRITTGEGSPLLGGRKREKVAAQLTLPVQWVIAETPEVAQRAYAERWKADSAEQFTPRNVTLPLTGSTPVVAPRTAAPRVQLMAVQARWSLSHYRDAASFAAYVEGLMAQVEARREVGVPCLVAFPEFIGLPLLFVDAVPQLQGCTRWREAGKVLIEHYQPEVADYCRRFGVNPLRGLLLARSNTIRHIYLDTFSRAAARHHCYLVAGSVPLPEITNDAPRDGRVYNTSFFFGPDGKLLGTQKKVHPYGLQGAPEGLDLTPGPLAEVRTFSTEFGRVGIAVCYDAWQDEVMDALANQRAVIVVQPSANAHAWDEWQQGDWKKGLWRQLQRQSAFQYGVNPMILGWLFAPDDEYACDGQSAILAQTALTADRSGYLVRASLPRAGRGAQEQVIATVVPVMAQITSSRGIRLQPREYVPRRQDPPHHLGQLPLVDRQAEMSRPVPGIGGCQGRSERNSIPSVVLPITLTRRP